MFTYTFEINQKCNLRCSYCYVGDKNNQEMDFGIAKKSIDYAIEKLKYHRDKRLTINFIGGEPLINFEFIKAVITYCEKQNAIYNMKYMITTNGLLLNEEIIGYLIKKKFSLKISIDGSRETNDRNRVDWNGNGSYNRIIDKIDLLRKFQYKTGKLVQVTNVVTKNNYNSYTDSLIHITRELGLLHVDTGLDTYTEWNKDERNQLADEIEKSLYYFMDCCENEKSFFWSPVFKAIDSLKPCTKAYACGAGIISMYVRVNGDIYPCPVAFEDNLNLGNIIDGVNEERILELRNLNHIENKSCKSCSHYTLCRTRRCIFGNLAEHKDIDIPSSFSCWYTKLMNRLLNENNERLSHIMPIFATVPNIPTIARKEESYANGRSN